MIGQILDYWGRFDDAIEAYKKVISPSSQINQAILYKIIEDQTSLTRNSLEISQSSQIYQQKAIYYFYKLVQNQSQYQNIASMYLRLLFECANSMQSASFMELKVENINNNASRTNSEQQECLSEQPKLFEMPDDCFEQNLNINFQVRKDIKMFYQKLRNDFKLEKHKCIRDKLDEFVKKTHFLKYESIELFNNYNLGQQIGQGGNCKVYRFNFQGQSYAAKVIQFQYMNPGDAMNQDDIFDIENKLKEICIICDITISKTKYCLVIEHLGLQYEQTLGKQQIYQIILITKFYDNHQQLRDWNEMDKIKYIYKLSLGLTTLQVERELLHLDLKPENVLVDSKQKNPVLADFGLSKYFQMSQYLSGQNLQMTYKYIDPELVANYQSRKNDVYSFGFTLFQYFSGCIPYEGIFGMQIRGKINQFQEHHQAAIKSIKNDFIQNLIIDCTKPIKNRILFVQVIKRLFIQIINCDHLEYQQNNRKIKKFNCYIKVIKSFIKYSNDFQIQKQENRVLQYNEILSSMTSYSSFLEIIQRMKQFINKAILNQHNFVLKLLDFSANYNQINQNETQIIFNFWVEDAEKILSTNLILYIPFYFDIIQILKQIHEQKIYFLQMPLDQIYLKDNKIKLNCFNYSQNLKIDQNASIEIDDFNFEPNIDRSTIINQNNTQTLYVLFEQTFEIMRQKLDQNIYDKVSSFLKMLKQNQILSQEDTVSKLQN